MRFKRVIIGATFYACGLAAKNPGETLLLESSGQPGSDWVFSFHPGFGWGNGIKHPAALDFVERLRRHDILRGDAIQPGGLAPVFSEWCQEHRLIVHLLSDVVEHRGGELKILTPGGIVAVLADEILHADAGRNDERFATALLFHPHHPPERCDEENFSILPTAHPDESCLLLKIPGNPGWPETRDHIRRVWTKRPARYAGWKIVLISSRFWRNSFANPAAALEAGLTGGTGK